MADLYIECDTARPWASPWIWLSSDDGGVTRIPKATLGQQCFINVMVGTRKATFQPISPRVKVQMWVSDFTLGIGPASNRQYAGSFPEAGQTVSILSAITTTEARVARLAWTPASGDMRNVNAEGQAHMCVAANTYWEGSDPPPEPGPMPPPDVINVCPEQHHGQLNIGILPTADEEFVMFFVPHGKWWQDGEGRDDRRYTVEIREPVARLGTVERETLAVQPFVRLAGVDLRAAKRKLPRDEDGKALEPLVRTLLRMGARATIGGRPLAATRRKPRVLQLEAGDQKGKKLEVRVPPGRKPLPVRFRCALAAADPVGAFKVVDVVQRRGNRVVGGARVVVVKNR